MEKERILEIRKEYNQSRKIYNEFCDTLLFLLKKLLKNNGFQFQMVSARVKEEDSLITKLSTNRALSNINSISELDDIAGSRVIFYLDSEIQKFVKYIYEEFDVVKNNLRYSEDGYNAQHLIIKFKEDRLNLAEYAQFKEMKCELQLTTVLYHAWSEVSHNITYKSPQELVEFDKVKMDFIQTELKTIMKDYIKPANYKFEFINTEYLELLKGNEIFQNAFYEEILLSDNLSEIYLKLSLLAKYIKKYGDKTPSGYKLTDFIKEVLTHSQGLGEESSDFLSYGNDYSYVVTQCLEILNVVMYHYTDQVFPIYIELALNKSEKISKQGLDSIKRLAKYKLGVLQQIGIQLQIYIIDQIKKWDIHERLAKIEVLNCVLVEVFQLDFNFTENIDYKTMGIGNRLLKVDESLKQLRIQSMEILKELYLVAEEVPQQLRILDVLEEATKTPIRGGYPEEIENLVVTNTISLINWYLTIVNENVPLEIIKKIDEQTNWFQRRFSTNIEGLSNLTKLIKDNDRYNIYKDLVGYDLDYLEELDWRKSKLVRNEIINNYLESITEENKAFWIKLIVDICKGSEFTEPGKYSYFNKFLVDVSKFNQHLAKELIFCLDKDYKTFLHHIIAGLRISDGDYAQKLLDEWINEGRNLISCALSFRYDEEVDTSILKRLFEKASYKNENDVLIEIVRILNTTKVNKDNSTELLIRTINELSRKNIFWWTNFIWLDDDSIFYHLDDVEQEQLIETLICCPQIDYHVEEILTSIAKSKPLNVVQFFEKRLLDQDERKKLNPQYKAIPFNLHRLDKPLKERSEIVIPEIFNWFKRKDWLFSYEASDLLHKIFPSFDEPLESFLRTLLVDKDIVEAEIILEVLGKYDGDSSIFPFCQEFVIAYQENTDLLTSLMGVLSRTGVVTGEYGFVKALQNTKSLIRKWNKSESRPLKNFAKDFIDRLNSSITHETKRSDEYVKWMQYVYGTSNDE